MVKKSIDESDLRELCLLGGINRQDAQALACELNPAACQPPQAEKPTVTNPQVSLHTALRKESLCHG